MAVAWKQHAFQTMTAKNETLAARAPELERSSSSLPMLISSIDSWSLGRSSADFMAETDVHHARPRITFHTGPRSPQLRSVLKSALQIHGRFDNANEGSCVGSLLDGDRTAAGKRCLLFTQACDRFAPLWQQPKARPCHGSKSDPRLTTVYG
jgi:hypothetical protein